MRFNISHLLKAPVGTKDVVHLDKQATALGRALTLHYLRGDVILTRSTDGLLAEGQLHAALDSECARCLEPFFLPLTFELDDLTFALPQFSSENHQYYVTGDGWIDLGPALSEQIVLNLPISPTCRPDCRGICSQCGQDLNIGTCGCEEQIIDPRLAILKDLL